MTEPHEDNELSAKKGVRRKIVRGRGYAAYMPLMEKRGLEKYGPAGRNGQIRKLRGYHLAEAKLQLRLEQWRSTGKFVSPYSHGPLSDILLVLSRRVNQPMLLSDVRDALREVMSVELTDEQVAAGMGRSRVRGGITDWDRFNKKGKTGKSTLPSAATKKIMFHALSLRKINLKTNNWPQGYKLCQMGCCVDIFRVMDGESKISLAKTYLRLNTHSTTPLKLVVDALCDIPPVDTTRPTLGPA